MNERIKMLIVFNGVDKVRDKCIEWCDILQKHLDKKVKCIIEERRVETPFAIIDFAYVQSIYGAKGYAVILKSEEDDEKVLRLAIGKETL